MKLLAPLVDFIESGLAEINDQNKLYSEEVMNAALSLFASLIETNPLNQQYFLDNCNCIEILGACLNLNEYLPLCGKGCLILSHLLHQNRKAQEIFATTLFVERLIFLSDFNQLINESDPESSLTSLQQISLFSLLAIINHTSTMQEIQMMYGKDGLIITLIKQLKNPLFEPKQAALLCLSNLLPNNLQNQMLLKEANGIMLLSELISDNDEEDHLSEKAYKCLEYLGPIAID